MFPTPRFVSLVDAAEGDFDKWIEAPSLPAPLSPSEAPHLHSYVQSFLTEVFDWSACEAQGPQGYVRPDHLLDVDAVPVQDSTRSDCWTVRIQAILKTGSEATTVLGFAVNPTLNQHQLYVWTYLMLSQKYRREPWVIVESGSGRVIDWRQDSPVPDGDYELRLRGDLMVVAFNRSPTLFSARNEYARSASNLSSSSTARSSRSWTPKAVIRARDQECLVSGSPMLDDDSWLGEMKVAHILPNGQPWLADKLRFVLDPVHGFGEDHNRSWRRSSPNHPSNLMMLRSGVEKSFDSFKTGVDVLGQRPFVIRFRRNAAGPPRGHEGSMVEGYEFPALPYESRGTPGPSAAFLLVHFSSILATTCRLRMSDESVEDEPQKDDDESDVVEMPEMSRRLPSPADHLVETWLSDLPNDLETFSIAAQSPDADFWSSPSSPEVISLPDPPAATRGA